MHCMSVMINFIDAIKLMQDMLELKYLGHVFKDRLV